MENNIKKHPAYKEAVEQIIKIFEEKGYGAIITDDEFDGFLSIEHQPDQLMTDEQYKTLSLERLGRYAAIKELLEEYCICLSRQKDIDGFEIVHPRDQVQTVHDKAMAKVRRGLHKAAVILSNLDHTLLTMEEEKNRQARIIRNAFVKGALSRKRIDYKEKEIDQKMIAS